MKKSLISLGIVSLLVLNGCESKSEQTAPGQGDMPPMPVTVLEAQPRELAVNVNLPGRLEPFRKAEVRARVSGILLKRTYEEGQDVKEGELLFTIDPAPYEAIHEACVAAVQRAKANLANIQDKEQRYRPLAEKGSVSERDHTELVLQEKMALAELASAQAELKKADLELGYTRVTSPISGRARAELVTEGALVGHGTPTPLTTVEQLDPIYVRFNQPASELNAIKLGVNQSGWKKLDVVELPIQIILADGTPYKHEGKLVFSDMSINPDTDTIQMKATFPNPEYELLPGAYVRVSFDRAVRNQVYLVPRVAVMKVAQGTFAMVVDENNTAQMVPVKADEMEGDNWIVTEGLKAGDKVIVEKSLMLVHPGSKVVVSKVLGKDEEKAQTK